MNNFNPPLDNNFNNEDEELNKKINEYNKIYSNNNAYNSGINLNFINSKNKTETKNSLTKKQNQNNVNNINNIKFNHLINKSKNKNNILNNSPSSDYINISEIDNKYDTYILDLKMQLSKEKEERKKKEEEAILIQHRLTLLKNQEQSKLLQLKKIKQYIDRIINNRKKSQEKINEKLMEKKNLNFNNSTNKSWVDGKKNNSQIKKNISYSKLPKKPKNLMCNSQSNFYSAKYKNFDLEKNNDNNSAKKDTKKKLEKNNVDDSDNFELLKRINKVNIRLDSDENKKIFKQHLIEKIKQDEEEKRRLEEEIAKIEEEEKNLLLQLEKRRLNVNNKENNYGYYNDNINNMNINNNEEHNYGNNKDI